MSSPTPFSVRWMVGRYVATLTGRTAHDARITWEPGIPGELSDDEREQYRKGRDEALERLQAPTKKGGRR